MAEETQFSRTLQGDMIPVQEQDPQAIKRVFKVRKQRRELFGWRLIPIDKFLYVASVQEKNVDFDYTAAYRSGVRFGDRITHVNGNPITSKTDTYALDLELEQCLDVQIDMVETPLFHRHSVDVVSDWEAIGIQYENAFITAVTPNSPAAGAKLPVEETIIQVNNASTLGMTDEELKNIVGSAAAGAMRTGRHHFLLVTMKRDYAEKMLENLRILLMTEKHKFRSVADYVDHSISMDPHRGSLEVIERIQFKEVEKPESRTKQMMKSLKSFGSSGAGAVLHVGGTVFDKAPDVILTPRRSIRTDRSDSDKLETDWDYTAQSNRSAKSTLPRFVVDETLHGTIRTKELRFREGRETVVLPVPSNAEIQQEAAA